jgi:hypothetical protein
VLKIDIRSAATHPEPAATKSFLPLQVLQPCLFAGFAVRNTQRRKLIGRLSQPRFKVQVAHLQVGDTTIIDQGLGHPSNSSHKVTPPPLSLSTYPSSHFLSVAVQVGRRTPMAVHHNWLSPPRNELHFLCRVSNMRVTVPQESASMFGLRGLRAAPRRTFASDVTLTCTRPLNINGVWQMIQMLLAAMVAVVNANQQYSQPTPRARVSPPGEIAPYPPMQVCAVQLSL